MSFSPEKLRFKLLSAFALLIVFVSANVTAQTKKKSNQKKTPVSTNQKTSKTQSKKTDSKKEKSAKSDRTDSKQKSARQKTADAKKATADKKSKTPRTAEKKRAAAELAKQRAAQEERRQAALAEQRRRAQIAREAQARRLAFERGLRTETVENILKDNTEGEDLEIRRAAVNALGTRAGTVVVMEPQTGKVLTIVNQDWAIRKSFKPCSTIKLVTAVAALNENMINGEGNIINRRFPMNLDDALAFSNNSYFQTVGKTLGNEKMLAYAQMLGLGTPTGINAENETGGKLAFGNNNARIYSHGDDFEVSPLQLGVMVSTISNGGRIVIPQIPRSKIQKTSFRGAMRYQLNLPNNRLQGVIPGMIGATAYGTARRGMDSTLAVAGKTGSCIGNGSWVGLFASVAPVENPQYAVIVITRGQAERGKYAAAIAGKIYDALRSRIIENGNKNIIAKVPLELRPQTKVNAKTSARLDTDEDSDSEDNDAAVTVKKETVTNQNALKPLIKKTGKSTELFPPVVVTVKKSNEITRPRVVPDNPRITPNQ